MGLEDAIEIRKPEPDSHFRLKNCRCCGGDNVAYVKYLADNEEFWRVQCFDCHHTVQPAGAVSRHDAQLHWNGIPAAMAIGAVRCAV